MPTKLCLKEQQQQKIHEFIQLLKDSITESPGRAHSFKFTSWTVEAGGYLVVGKPELYSKTMFHRGMWEEKLKPWKFFF